MTIQDNDVMPLSCFVIAEAGVNHDGNVDRALALVDAAAAAGADAAKFQIFSTDLLVAENAPRADYQIRNTGDRSSQREMLKGLELGKAAFRDIADHCAKTRIEFMATPFDAPSLEWLIDLGVKRIKISSGDVTNGPLLLKVAATRLPIILSTGMCALDEISEALGVIAFGLVGSERPSRQGFAEAWRSAEGRSAVGSRVTLLHCTSNYPAEMNEVNLLAMDTLASTFGLPVGYSDHTIGLTVPIAAAARGARVIEKHLTLNRGAHGPDHAASMEPGEFSRLVRAIRNVDICLGRQDKGPTESERQTMRVARRSLTAVRPIAAGAILTEEDFCARRPGTGRSPMSYWDILGTRAARAYSPGDLID
jgi:N-acetylneuraminate synthase